MVARTACFYLLLRYSTRGWRPWLINARMKSRSRIRRRPGHGSAELIHKEQRSQHEEAPIRNGTTAARRPMIHRRHHYLLPVEEKSTRRGTAHDPLEDCQSLHLSNAISGGVLPMLRRRKPAHIAVSVLGGTNGKSFSPTTSRRSHRCRRLSALPMATVAALATTAVLSSPSIFLASAAEMESPEAPVLPVPKAQNDHDDDVASSAAAQLLHPKDPSSFKKAGNLRRKGDNNTHPRQDTNMNADARHLSRVFADGRPSSNGFDFDVSFLDAPARDNNYYGDPVLITEMGRPQDEKQEEKTSDTYDNSTPTLAALLDSDNHHHRPSTTPLTDALTISTSTVQARIVGGTKTPRPPNLRYPYMVSLQRRDYPICGAFLIAPDCILTAAHCRGSFDYAELGRWNLAADTTESYQYFDIVECTMHPNFTYFEDRQIGNDFMVCKLDRKADVDKYPPVKLNANPSVPQTSEAVTVVGWGRTSSGGARSDQQLQATVNVVSNNQCRQAQGCIGPGQCYGYQNIIKSNMLCAQSPGQDSCQGDSGGPLIVPGNEEDGSGDTIVGIVSFGVGCAEPLFPGIYARISSAEPWVAAETERLSDYGGIRVVTSDPTASPTPGPTEQPTSNPSASPSAAPSTTPTVQKSAQPSSLPTMTPSSPPSLTGSAPPSISPPPTYLNMPSSSPTMSASPTQSSQNPSSMPSSSDAPSSTPTIKEEEEDGGDEPDANEYDNERWRRRRYRPGTVSITREDGEPLGDTDDGTAPAATEWFTCPQEHILQAKEAECDPAQVTTCSYDQYCWNSCTQRSYVAGVFASTCRPSVRKFERIPTMMCPLFACKKPQQSSSDGDEVSGRIADDPITEEKPATTTKTTASLNFFMDRNRQRQHNQAHDDVSR